MKRIASLLSGEAFSVVAAANRRVLSGVSAWLDDPTYGASLCGYGLPAGLRAHIDLDIGPAPTYSDAILYLSSRLAGPARYFEIGVSAGKNFLQAAMFFDNAVLVGFDIERMNPELERHFNARAVLEEWPSPRRSVRKDASSLAAYCQPGRDNRVFYCCADINDESAWQRLEGHSFNIIFSDAVHAPESVLHELRMVMRHHLLDTDEFIIAMDDLAGPMVTAFDEVWDTVGGRGAYREIVSLNGWLGKNEPPHQVGFIVRPATNFL